MEAAAGAPLQESDLQGWKYFRRLTPLLARLHEAGCARDRAGNRALHAALDARGIEHQYEEFAGGHDWPYWRLHLADTLRFLDGAATRAPGGEQ